MIPSCDYKDSFFNFHHSIDQHPDDADFTMHVHEYFEIFYFISGDADYLIEGSRYPLEPGSLLLMRPTETHCTKILSDTAYERYSLHFSPELLNIVDPAHKLLMPFTAHPLGQNNLYRPSDFKGEQPLEFFEAMCLPVSEENDRRLEILTHLYPLLGAIRHAFLQKQEHENTPSSQSLSEELIAYINFHLFDELSLDFLASRFFLSTSQLGRRFKQATGSSIWEYITIKRLMAAREKIKTGMPVGSAFQECGFHDYSSFYRAYVRRFGVSPKEDSLKL